MGKIKARPWTNEDVMYLCESWGFTSIYHIAKNLKRTQNAVILKAGRLKLGPFLDAGDYITIGLLMKIMGKERNYSYTKQVWIEEGLPVKSKKVLNSHFQVVDIADFWRWAKKHKTLIDFSDMESLSLGAEPDWVAKQRDIDREANFFKKAPWTIAEDYLLESLVNSYKYNYREISLRLRRTEGAIKRRLIDLDIKARPIRLSNHNPWTKEEVDKLIKLFNAGHSRNTFPNYINRSAQSCGGKIERLIKEGVIQPRTARNISC